MPNKPAPNFSPAMWGAPRVGDVDAALMQSFKESCARIGPDGAAHRMSAWPLSLDDKALMASFKRSAARLGVEISD